jgi:hypothetical protein
MFAFLYVFFRLRPRAGWGVTVDPEAVTVARPLSGGKTEVRWSEINLVQRGGRRRDTLVLFLKSDARVLIPRHLFASRKAFESLAEAVEERAPAPRFDA